jgi:hypothetical protein
MGYIIVQQQSSAREERRLFAFMDAWAWSKGVLNE